MSFVKEVDGATFGQDVLQRSHEVPVVVDFWAEWCRPCKVLGPILERLAGEYEGAFELVKVDIDRNPQLAAQFGVQGIPHVIGFRDGDAAGRFTGAIPESSVRQWLTKFLPTETDHIVDQARDAVLAGDGVRAEELFSRAIELDPSHHDAATGLASLMIGRGETEQALIVLGRLTPTAEVDRLQATARLGASRSTNLAELQARVTAAPGNEQVALELGLALAANREYEAALDRLLDLVARKGTRAEEARQGILDIFELLGAQSPLTLEYRRRLANVLY